MLQPQKLLACKQEQATGDQTHKASTLKLTTGREIFKQIRLAVQLSLFHFDRSRFQNILDCVRFFATQSNQTIANYWKHLTSLHRNNDVIQSIPKHH